MSSYQQLGSMPFHSGEKHLRKFAGIKDSTNYMSPFLADHYTYFLSTVPLLIVGTLDSESRPWTSILSIPNKSGRDFIDSVERNELRIDAKLTPGDPGLDNLQRNLGNALMVSALGIDPEVRRRVKMFGRTKIGKLGCRLIDSEEEGRVIMKLNVEQSMGNCPKYITTRRLIPHNPLLSSSAPTSAPEQTGLQTSSASINDLKEMITNSELFYITTRQNLTDMDTNHRGGNRGFVRLLLPDSFSSTTVDAPTIIWPEYAGNNMYSTLGNLLVTPLAGLTFPNYTSGDVLFLTGSTELLLGDAAAEVLPGSSSKIAVKLRIDSWKLLRDALPIREVDSQRNEASPYNPPVVRLASEVTYSTHREENSEGLRAILMKKKVHAVDIATFSFHILHDEKRMWKAGQHVLLDFSEALGKAAGDPDIVKTFTISSSAPETTEGSGDFEITVRKVGRATTKLFTREPGTVVPVLGFAGKFIPTTDDEGDEIRFVAGGVGITPWMAVAAASRPGIRLRVWWAVRGVDLDFVEDVIGMFRKKGVQTDGIKVFVSGNVDGRGVAELGSLVQVYKRRMKIEDLQDSVLVGGEKGCRWWICASGTLRELVLSWIEKLGGKSEYEMFEY